MPYPTIEATVDLKFEEFFRINLHVLFKKWILVVVVFLIPCLSILYTLPSVLREGVSNLDARYLPALIPFIMPVLIFASLYSAAKKQMATSSFLKQTQHYVFSSEGINISSLTSSSHSDWVNIREAVETKAFFLLMSGLNQGFFIPKRCFQSEAAIPEFRALLVAELGAKAKLKA